MGYSMEWNEQVRRDAEVLYRYHRLDQDPAPWLEKADGILVFGSHDLRVPERAAELFIQMSGQPIILFTGGAGKVTQALWQRSEAAMFAEIAVGLGVPRDAVILEEKASNTGENIRFSKEILDNMKRGGVLIAVDKPARERRTYAALKKQWPELEFCVTSPACSFSECMEYYENGAGGTGVSAGDFICIMIGDLERMERYAEQGFQIPVKIPEDVSAAAERLRAAGFSGK